MAVALTTSRFDSRIDRRIADDRGQPAGDIGPIRVGELDLARFVAFRPDEINQIHSDGVFGTIGLNLLEHLRIEVDRENRKAWIVPTREPDFPVADLEYFRAIVDGEAEPLARYLADYPNSRLSGEGARTLLDLQLDEEESDETIEKTLRLISDNYSEDLRATAAYDLMSELL